MTSKAEPSVSRFASFFKLYCIGIGLMFAAVPVMTRAGQLLPMYESVKDILTFTTSLVCFLTIAVLFGVRRQIGEAVFPRAPGACISRWEYRRSRRCSTTYPIVFAGLAVISVAGYLLSMAASLETRASGYTWTNRTATQMLSETLWRDIPYLIPIVATYALMFFATTTAFIWMGLIEYAQTELGIRDRDLIRTPYVPMPTGSFKLGIDLNNPDAFVLYDFEYDPQEVTPTPELHGPFCVRHYRRVFYEGLSDGKHVWVCQDSEKKKSRHAIVLPHDDLDLPKEAQGKARMLIAAELADRNEGRGSTGDVQPGR
jgi:hypothetical protein